MPTKKIPVSSKCLALRYITKQLSRKLTWIQATEGVPAVSPSTLSTEGVPAVSTLLLRWYNDKKNIFNHKRI